MYFLLNWINIEFFSVILFISTTLERLVFLLLCSLQPALQAWTPNIERRPKELATGSTQVYYIRFYIISSHFQKLKCFRQSLIKLLRTRVCGVDFLRCAKQRPQTAHRVLDYFLRPEYAFSRRLERVKCIDASVLHFASERFRLSGGVVKASMVVPRRAAIAHWICLQLPSCHPGFKPQAHHLCFFNL